MKFFILSFITGILFSFEVNGKTVLYGMTQYGGANGQGAIIEYDPVAHTYAASYSFDGVHGSYPMGSLLDYRGKFYGMTSRGGANDLGVLFEYNPVTATCEVKFSFDSINGSTPYGSLVDFNGLLYGMTRNGGILDEGVIFQYDPSNESQAKIWDFNDETYGMNPYGSLVVYNNTLWGFTTYGGAYDCGLMFYWSFEDSTCIVERSISDGLGRLNYGTPFVHNNKLYGTFRAGGGWDRGTVYEYDGLGMGFDLLYEFNNSLNSNGELPSGSTVVYNGKLYGTTTTGGANGSYGTLFEISLSNYTFARKHSFKNDAAGYYPCGGLTVYNNKIYGLTRFSNGSIFEFDPVSGTMTNSVSLNSTNGYNPAYPTLIVYDVRYRVSITVSDGIDEISDATVKLTSNNRIIPYSAPAFIIDTVSGIYHYEVSRPGYEKVTGTITVSDADVAENVVLTVSQEPFILINNGLNIPEGETSLITSVDLITQDMQQDASLLTYTITSAPTHGFLEKTSNPGITISSFTQENLNNNTIKYVNDGITGASDEFYFTVSDGAGNTTAETMFSIPVTAVNDAPFFIKGNDITVMENEFTQTIPNWATSISKGGSDESSQIISFRVTNDNPSLFSSQPYISATGTLYFRSADNKHGEATVRVRLGDNGGTVNGGIDSSEINTFLIHVTPIPELSLSVNSLNISAQSGEADFDIYSNTGWTISSSETWIQLQTVSGSENSPIHFTATDNPLTTQRTATITVAAGSLSETLSIIQAGGLPYLSLSTNVIEVPADFSDFEFDISANCSWIITCNVPWMYFNTSFGNGAATIQCHAQENTVTSERTGIITVNGAGSYSTITVTQSASDPILMINAGLINLPSSGGGRSFDLISNINWTISSSENWLSVNPVAGSNSQMITVAATEPNTTTSDRQAILTITGTGISRQLYILQSHPGVTLSVSNEPLSIAETAGSIATFAIESNSIWSISCSDHWLSADKICGSGNSVITITAEENTELNERTATVNISGSGTSFTVSVTQIAGAPYLSVSTGSLIMASAEGSTGLFEIHSNSLWIINSSQSWLTINNVIGEGNSPIQLTASANTGTNERTAVLTISSGNIQKTINVTQTHDAAILSVSTNSLSMESEGGEASFDIVSNASWNVNIYDSWLSVNQTEGQGNGAISLTASANPFTEEREAIISVSGAGVESYITIIQSAGEPSLSLSVSSVNVPAGFNMFEFNLSSNSPWTISGAEPWFICSNNSGKGDRVIYVLVSENFSTGDRTGTITVTGAGTSKTITIVQAANVPVLEILTNYINLESTAGSIATFEIVSNSAWAIENTETWLNTDQTSGSGNMTVTLTVSENSSLSERTAIIKVTSGTLEENITVVQSFTGAVLTISENSVNIPSEGGLASIDISSNAAWMIQTQESWISISEITGSGDATFTISATSNPLTTERTASVVISGAGKTCTITVTQGAGITDLITLQDKTIKVYPNPVTDNLCIENENSHETFSINVFSVNGVLVLSRPNNNERVYLDFSELKPGLYFVKVNGEVFKVERR